MQWWHILVQPLSSTCPLPPFRVEHSLLVIGQRLSQVGDGGAEGQATVDTGREGQLHRHEADISTRGKH